MGDRYTTIKPLKNRHKQLFPKEELKEIKTTKTKTMSLFINHNLSVIYD